MEKCQPVDLSASSQNDAPKNKQKKKKKLSSQQPAKGHQNDRHTKKKEVKKKGKIDEKRSETVQMKLLKLLSGSASILVVHLAVVVVVVVCCCCWCCFSRCCCGQLQCTRSRVAGSSNWNCVQSRDKQVGSRASGMMARLHWLHHSIPVSVSLSLAPAQALSLSVFVSLPCHFELYAHFRFSQWRRFYALSPNENGKQGIKFCLLVYITEGMVSAGIPEYI